MSKKAIMLKGLLLSPYVPSDERLVVPVDCSELGREGYMTFVYKMQELFKEIDQAYAKEKEAENGTITHWKTKGRTIHSRHIIDYDTMKRGNTPKILPYPSRYSNILKAIRAKVYSKINDYCLVLQTMQSGRFRRSIYLLPQTRAKKMIQEIDGLNKEIKELNKSLEKFRATNYFQRIQEIFQKSGLYTGNLTQEHSIPDIDLHLTPLGLDPAVLDEVVQKRIAEKQKTYIQAALKRLENEVEPIIHRIAGKIELKKAKEDLEKLRTLAEETGLQALADTVITPLSIIADNPNEAVTLSQQYFQNSDLGKGVSGRMKGLLGTLLK